MFKNEFQGGPYLEVFSAQAKDAISAWKQTGSGAKKEFDKAVHSFVYVMEGSTATTKIQIPKDSKQSLTLIQRFVILQLCVPKGHDLSVDLSISDLSNQKRHLVLSTMYKETKTNPLHSKIPLGFIKRSKWINLCFDMVNLVGQTWHSQTYKCLDCICIAGNCRLRRIFTMKQQPLDTTDDEELYGFTGINNGLEGDRIPKQCQLATDVPQAVQVVTTTKIMHFEGRGNPPEPLTSRTESRQDLDLNSSGGKKSGLQENYHIAFGTKVTGTGQPRKGSGKERSTSSHPSKSIHTRHKRNPSAESLHDSRALTESVHHRDVAQCIDPHPPREPSSEKRRRPRVKSAGQDHSSSQISKDDSSSAYSSMNSSRGASQSRSNSGNKSTRNERAQVAYQQPRIIANDDEVEQIIREMAKNTHDHGKSETDSDCSHNTSDILVQHHDATDEEFLLGVIKSLNEHHLSGNEQEDDERDIDIKDTDLEKNMQRKSQNLYTFVSRPKAVPDKTCNTKSERNTVRAQNRNVRSYMQFGENLSSLTTSSDENEVESSQKPMDRQRSSDSSRPKRDSGIKQYKSCSKKRLSESPQPKNNGLLQVVPQLTKSPHSSQTRLSVNRRSLREINKEDWRKSQKHQPYDANKYQPNKMAEVTDSYEQRMLASLQRHMMASNSDSLSDEEERPSKLHQYEHESLAESSDDDTERSTLKAHYAASQRSAHSYQDEMKILSQEFLSNSNPRDWGNVFSPPIALSSVDSSRHGDDLTTAPEANNRDGESDGDEMLDLLYDPVLNCYYDPVSCKYYELV